MPVLNTISSDKLVRLVGIPSGPVVIDVRPEDEFATEPLLIPGTLRRAAADIGIWQRRYWEHLVRDEDDLQRHVDYIHFNPVKHGHVARAVDWPYSTLHRYVAKGWLAEDWGGVAESAIEVGERG